MDGVKNKAFTNAREYFSDELKLVLEKHQIIPQEQSFNYLVTLLCRHIESDKFFSKKDDGRLEDTFLVELYNEYINADLPKKRVVLQRLGDICLMISGFFAESLQRKIIDIDYYFGMGGTAYRQLSHLQPDTAKRGLYGELSEKFRPFSDVLNEMSERSGINSNRDLLRLYERWLSTGNIRIKSVLEEHGISAPVPIDPKQKH